MGFFLRIVLVFLVGKLILPYLPGISPRLVEVADRAILLGLTLFFVLRQGSLRQLGFNFDHPGRQIGYGIAAAIPLYLLAEGTQRALVFLFAADTGTNPLVKAAAGAAGPAGLLLPIVIGGILVPITEEAYYRGMAFSAFARKWGIALGVAVSSVFFSAAHLSGIWFAQIAVVGAALAIIYHLTGSLLPGIIAHGLVNSARLLMVYWGNL
nr:type II CAAX endopeptidase family protein [Desulforamulus aquiferis]